MHDVLLTTQKPIAIEMVGESWWHGLLGPALLAVAAIVAAGLAAYVAIRNHRDQLAYDRAIRDREYGRESIRAATETIVETLDPLNTYELAIRANDKATKHAEPVENSANEQAEASEQLKRRTKRVRMTRDNVGPLLIKMTADSISLRIALGADEPVVKRYRELSKAFNDRFRMCAPTDEGRAKREVAVRDGDPQAKAKAALEAFQTACEEWDIANPPAERAGWFWGRVRSPSIR
jgi:hypothetical protein